MTPSDFSRIRAVFTVGLFAWIMLVMSPAAVASSLILVGTDPNCDTANLQQAVSNVSNGGTVLIANNQSYDGVALEIAQKSLTLVGGYESCSSLNPSDRTVLGRDTSRAINIAFGTSTYEVNLSNLEITGVVGSGDGAAIRLGNRTHLTLDNVLIHGNTTSGRGGAIYMNGPIGQRVSVDFPGTEITNNQARLGGAIYCEESSGTIRGGMVDLNAVLISGNHATEDGGGIYLEDCDMVLRAGARDGTEVVAGIVGNHAARNGGGLYVSGESEVLLEPAILIESRPLIDGNQAGERGGGIYCTNVDGERPDITMTAGLIHGNSAWRGGGLLLRSCDAAVFASGPEQGIQNNLAEVTESDQASPDGGGIRVELNGSLILDGGNRDHSPADQPIYLTGNRSIGGGAGAALLQGFGAEAHFTDVWIVGNSASASPALDVRNNSALIMDHSEDGRCIRADGPDSCSQIIDNVQTDLPNNFIIGTVVFLSGNSVFEVERTVIRGNRGGPLSAVFQLFEFADQAPQLGITSSLVVDNEAARLLRSTGNSHARIAWTTIADNHGSADFGSVFWLQGSDTTEPGLDLISSIVWQPTGVFSQLLRIDGMGKLNLAHCLVTHDPDAVADEAATVFRVVGDDPRFGAPQRGDWTVTQSSPAFQCDGTYYNGEADLVGAQRGILTSLPIPNPVIFTAGAYSIRSADTLFTDRFQVE